jgi:hypothetical protein
MSLNTKGRDNVEYVDIDGRVVLVFKLKTLVGWEGVHCVFVDQIQTNAGLGFHKMRGTFDRLKNLNLLNRYGDLLS